VRARRILLRVLYWLAVLVVSLAILVGLILLLESRDESSVGHTDARPAAFLSAPPWS
jgi:hypothetical protein